MMIKNVFSLLPVFFLILPFLIIKPAHAVFLELSAEQIEEAAEYGKKNKNIEMSMFAKPWTVRKEKGMGSATLFTPFHNVAYKVRKFAVERRDFTKKDILNAVEIGDAFTFSVTVYGEEYDFCTHYTAKLYYKDEVVQPEYEFIPDIAEASEFWPDPPSHAARMVFKFPTKDIDSNALISLAVVAPGGEENVFDFDLSKMK